MVKEYGYEYNAEVDEALLSRVGWSGTDSKLWGALCLRSGRDALKRIAGNYPGSTVFLPSLCCDSMITPFEMYGCDVVYYPLTKYITVDYSVLTKMLDSFSKKKIILLWYDYFGISMFEQTQLADLRRRCTEAVLIKDVTHNLLYNMQQEFLADYTIASLRKWINIPDGGLLWSKHHLKDIKLQEDSRFAEQRMYAQSLRTKYFLTEDQKTKNDYRRIFSEVSCLLEESKHPVKMTEYSYQISEKADWTSIRKQRKTNARLLNVIFSKSPNVEVINRDVDTADLYVPILVNDRDRVQSLLSKKGIFNTIIWPLRDEQVNACKTAKYIAEHMLAVPCDQRYTEDDMAFVGNEIVRVIDG